VNGEILKNNTHHKSVLYSIIILLFCLNVYGKDKEEFEIQVKPSLMHVEVDITRESYGGYVKNPFSFGASFSLISRNYQVSMSYYRFSWNREFTGRMLGVPSQPSPIEEIHESVSSNTFSIGISKKFNNSKIFLYIGFGVKINFLASEKTGQSTNIHLATDQFWYPGISLLAGVRIPIFSAFNISCEADICAIVGSLFVKVCDGYMPARSLLKVSSLSLGVGYSFQIPL
jgi:hypothetical protein